MKYITGIFIICLFCNICSAQPAPVRVSSKTFTESYILAEILSKEITSNFPAQDVKLHPGMGGTGLLFGALTNGDIDLYPEYTGTIAEAILKKPELKDINEINKALIPMGLIASESLGFNNTYAFAVKKKTARKFSLKTISDLAKHPDLRFGFSHEFLERSDGYHFLAEKYQLKHKNVHGLQHSLAYEAIVSDSLDLIDVYTTDAKIRKLGLQILEDDLGFFPRYDAVILANIKFVRSHTGIWKQLKLLEGTIDEDEMRRMNALVDLEKYSFKEAAVSFFEPDLHIQPDQNIKYGQIWVKTREHLFLVFVSLLFSITVGIPLGYLATSSRFLRQTIFAVSGIVQTVPSLASLCFLVPVMGIGVTPALTALFLYGLLPIVRNTCTSIESIDKSLKETSCVLGLKRLQHLFWIELPLSMPGILAGVKTSAIINVGTATLAAFIGCGGLGSFIVTGLALNDVNIMLHGAIPSAGLALILQWMFDGLDRVLIPKGIRKC